MSEVVPIRGKDDEPEQQEFISGFPVREKRFELTKAKDYTAAELADGQHVTFHGAGRVRGHKYDHDEQRWVWVIETLEVELEP